MSQTPTRARKAQELVKSLTTIADAEELDEWGIRRLEREARALMDADAVAAHIVLGGVAALEGDIAAVREHHRIALQLSGNSVEALRNGAASLSRVGEMNEAFEAMLQAHESIPDEPCALNAAISMAVQSAHFHKARELYRRRRELFPDEPLEDEASTHKAAGAVENRVFSEERARKVVQLAHHVRRSARIRAAGGSILALHGEPDSFLFEIRVRTSSQRAVELNEKFADRIVTDEELMADPGLKFTLVFIGTRTNGSDTHPAP